MSFLTEGSSKSKTTQALSPQSQALFGILARYLLASMTNRAQNPASFGQFRAGEMPNYQLAPLIYPGDASAIPGVGAPPADVNPILTNPVLFSGGAFGGGGAGRNF